MSYSSFSYSNLGINKKSFSPVDSVTVSVTVTNSGSQAGKEVVQLFISDLVAAALTPDVKRLRGFEKVMLQAGESKTVQFTVLVKDLAFVNPNNKKQIEEGDFRVQVGTLDATFNVTRSVVF